jgi:hypothetical protein
MVIVHSIKILPIKIANMITTFFTAHDGNKLYLQKCIIMDEELSFSQVARSSDTPPLARGEWNEVESNPYERNNLVFLKPAFTIIESVLTLAIIATSLTAIFSLETKLIRSVFGTHDIIHHLIGVRNFIVQDDQEELYKQSKGSEKKLEDFTITYEPKSSKVFPSLSNFKNIIVEKIKLSSKNVFKNYDEFIYFRFNPEGKK